jgi:hypothetical protein
MGTSAILKARCLLASQAAGATRWKSKLGQTLFAWLRHGQCRRCCEHTAWHPLRAGTERFAHGSCQLCLPLIGAERDTELE